MSLKKPIEAGGYYVPVGSKEIVGPATPMTAGCHVDGHSWWVGGKHYTDFGVTDGRLGLSHRIWPVSVDPEELVARLNEMAVVTYDQFGGGTQTADLLREALEAAANLVAEQLGVDR